jgi:hypothetical protein
VRIAYARFYRPLPRRVKSDRLLVTALPVIKNGMVQAPFGRGLCTALRPEVKLRDDATIRISGASPRS